MALVEESSVLFRRFLQRVPLCSARCQVEIVVPGHEDPNPCSHNFVGRFCKFDVSTATPTDRQVYVKAPTDGLPETRHSTAVAPFALLRMLKSAYGLAKVLRLWNLRALQWLGECGMKELNYARATNICVAFQKKCGCLKLHVDLACFQVVTTQSSRPRWIFSVQNFSYGCRQGGCPEGTPEDSIWVVWQCS